MSVGAAGDAARLRRATTAVFLAFIGSGFGFASWASRIPQVRTELELSAAQLGLVLLALAVGAIIALPLSGQLITRFGSRRTVTAMAVLLGVALAVVAVGYEVGVVVLVVGLFLLGFANGAWDVAMNVQGAVVEQHLRRSIMSRFHAGFSLGTVAGALLGTLMVALSIPVSAHLCGVAVIVAAAVFFGVQGFVPDVETDADGDAVALDMSAGPRNVLAAWREPRTLLIGVFVLAFAFAEGTGNDWISVAAIDGYGAPEALGTLTFALFLAAMTVGRWFGPGLLDRYGRVVVTRTLAAVAVVGVLVFVFGPTLAVAFAGAVLWGAGISLGFPVGMSAGADEPRFAPMRVSVIASIGYCAFLGGPPLIGFLGHESSVLKAIIAVAVLLGVATMLAGSTRPPARAGGQASDGWAGSGLAPSTSPRSS